MLIFSHKTEAQTPATKRTKTKTAALLLTSLMCFCITFVELRVESSADNAPTDQKQSETQQAIERGDVLRAKWTKDSLREAITQYEKAVFIATAASDFASASQATLKSGDVYLIFSEYGEALKRYQNAEALARKTGDWLMKANALSRMGRLQSFVGNNELAQQQLTEALHLFKEHEPNRSGIVANAYGEALSNLAEISYAKGNFVKAREQFKAALEVLQNDPKTEAKIHLFNGYITGSIGDLETAVTEISRALELYRGVNDKIGEGLALTALGMAPSLKRDVNSATGLYSKAIEIFHAAGDRHSEAVALNALGQVYEGVNNDQLAIDNYAKALRLFEEIGSVDVSVSIFKLARINSRIGRPDQALAFYERGLRLSRAAGKVRTEANALNEIATIYASHGRHELALQQYQKIRKFYEAIGDLRGQATALNAYADLLLRLRQNEKALDACRRSLPLSEKAGDKGILISALYNLGRANLAVGSPEVALPLIRRSLEIIEDLRANVASPDFRLSYFSGFQKHYKLCIEILMQLERLHSGEGFATDALLVTDRNRARLLFDLVRNHVTMYVTELLRNFSTGNAS